MTGDTPICSWPKESVGLRANLLRRRLPSPRAAWRGVLTALLGVWLWGAGAPTAFARHPGVERQASLATGRLLVAARAMGDPRFAKTVVLIVDHDQDGTLGLVLNRRSEVRLGELVSGLAAQDGVGHRVYAGGPVGMDQILFLVRHPTQPEHAVRVIAGLYASGALHTLEAMLAAGKARNELHVYLGSAGWIPGQLAGEVARGDWHVAPGTLQDVFAEYPEALWTRRIQAFEPEGLQARAPDLRHGSHRLVVSAQPASQVIGIVTGQTRFRGAAGEIGIDPAVTQVGHQVVTGRGGARAPSRTIADPLVDRRVIAEQGDRSLGESQPP